MKRTLTTLVLLLAILSACKKQNVTDPAPATGCRVSDYTLETSTDTTDFHISYDGQGRISEVSHTDATGFRTKTYTHLDHLIIIRRNEAAYVTQDSVILNDHGMPVFMRTQITGATDYTDNFYQYNGRELIARKTVTSSGSAFGETSYAWKDGNITSATSNGFTLPYIYYPDRENQPGDYIRFNELLIYGTVMADNHSLFKEYGTSAIAREFDADGKVISFTIDSGGPRTTRLKYSCPN